MITKADNKCTDALFQVRMDKISIASQILSKLLLKGWTMTSSSCTHCKSPLMTLGNQQHPICVVCQPNQIQIYQINLLNEIKSNSIKDLKQENNDNNKNRKIGVDYFGVIISYWIRINLLTLIFPNDIIKFISKNISHDLLYGEYMNGRGPNKILLNIENNHKFSIQLFRYYDPNDPNLESFIHDVHCHSINEILTGNKIIYDYHQCCYTLKFDNESLIKFVNIFNFILNHNKRKNEYIQRTKHLYQKHNILSIYDENMEYNIVTMSDKWYRADNYIDNVWTQKHKFIDYHDIYCKICNVLNEKPLPLYIGGECNVKSKSRYHLEFFFDNKLKWIFYGIHNFNSFHNFARPRIRRCCTISIEPHYVYTKYTANITIFKIDDIMNYFEIYFIERIGGQKWGKQTVKFKIKGTVNNDILQFDKESVLKIKQFLQKQCNITKLKSDFTIKFIQNKNNIQIKCDEIELWNLFELKLKETKYYNCFDYDTVIIDQEISEFEHW